MATNHVENLRQSLDAAIAEYEQELQLLDGTGARDAADRERLEPNLENLREFFRGRLDDVVNALHATRTARLRGER